MKDDNLREMHRVFRTPPIYGHVIDTPAELATLSDAERAMLILARKEVLQRQPDAHRPDEVLQWQWQTSPPS